MSKKISLRVCHPNGILRLGILSSKSIRELKELIREKLKIDSEKDYVASREGSASDPEWIETWCKKEDELCGNAFSKRGMKVYYRYIEDKESTIVIAVSYLPPVSQTVEFEFEDPSTKLSILFRKVRAHFAGAFDEFELENKENGDIYKNDEYERTLSDAGLERGASLRQVVVKKNTPPSSPVSSKLESSSKTEDWSLGMPCLVAITEHGPWKAGVIAKVKKSKSGEETLFTVFVPDMEPVRNVTESRLSSPDNLKSLCKENMSTISYPLVSTPFGFDAVLLDTQQDGYCTIGFGSGSIRDSLLRELHLNISSFLENDDEESLTILRDRIVLARRLARQCVLANGETLRVMRHEVKRKIPLDPPLPRVPQKKESDTFSLLQIDRDLESRRV